MRSLWAHFLAGMGPGMATWGACDQAWGWIDWSKTSLILSEDA
jgi:hypothetical protein